MTVRQPEQLARAGASHDAHDGTSCARAMAAAAVSAVGSGNASFYGALCERRQHRMHEPCGRAHTRAEVRVKERAERARGNVAATRARVEGSTDPGSTSS